MAKSKYESHVAPFLDKIAAWARKGATAKEIAKKLKVAYSTFRKYLDEGEKGDERYKALSALFAQACEEPDDEVEAALFHRAKGISYDEEIYEQWWDDKQEKMVEVCVKRTRKYIPPDPTSAMFWLANRRGDKWKYRPESGGKDDDEGTSGVVELPAVMPTPKPPEEAERNG